MDELTLQRKIYGEEVLNELREIKEKHPELRICQILYCAIDEYVEGDGMEKFFYIEDKELFIALYKYKMELS